MKLKVEQCAFCRWRYREGERVACVNADETVMICEPCVDWLREYMTDAKGGAKEQRPRMSEMRFKPAEGY
jgi:hypothetical protein